MTTNVDRRTFIRTGISAAAWASCSLLSTAAFSGDNGDARIKAIAFDAFPIFDPRPVFSLVKTTFPDNPFFGSKWFSKIFAYTWLRTNGNRYADFHTVIGQALEFTAQDQKVSMTSDQRDQLMSIWLSLKTWPDVADALDKFDRLGIRIAFLSNFSEQMLRANARNGGIEDRFEYLSTDRARVFKPDPRAYQLGLDHFGLSKQNVAFCAFAAWDAAGASWFGYPTVWVNRLKFAPENLDAAGIIEVHEMGALVSFTEGRLGT